MKKHYRSENGHHLFTFEFVPTSTEIEVYCRRHPGTNGQDPNPRKTHLFPSGKICFQEGRAPMTQTRAEELAKQFAEYFLEYRLTGKVQE